MNVMIVEPNGSGHHMSLYVRHVARKLVDSGITVTLLTTHSAVAHPSFQLVKTELKGKLNILFIPELPKNSFSSCGALLIKQALSWIILRLAFKNTKKVIQTDIVYVPTLDWIAKAVELFGSPFGDTRFVALYISPKHHRKSAGLGPASRQDWIYKSLFRRLLKIKTLNRVLVTDEYFFEYCQKHYDRLSPKVRYVTDFGEVKGIGTRKDCREKLGIGSQKKVILVYGALDKRKGIFELLDAFLKSEMQDNVIILIAGAPDDKIKNLMKTERVMQFVKDGRIILRLHFHSQSEEYNVFMASDYTWLGYVQGFYASSGVLYQSMHVGLPVIAMREGLIGSLVKKHSLGILVDTRDRESIIGGIKKVVELSDDPCNKSEIQKFLDKHNTEVHVNAVHLELIDSDW